MLSLCSRPIGGMVCWTFGQLEQSVGQKQSDPSEQKKMEDKMQASSANNSNNSPKMTSCSSAARKSARQKSIKKVLKSSGRPFIDEADVPLQPFFHQVS